MGEGAATARIVLTTTANPEEARSLARTLVDERLAACATVIPGVESIYRWKGEVESAMEAIVMIKTEMDQLEALEKRLHQLHSYETPEFLVMNLDGGSAQYLEWIKQGVGNKC
jgi:periplasmic divalent cation tolerance protein